MEMLKAGDMVGLVIDGYTVYGVVVNCEGDTANIEYNSPESATGFMTKPFKTSEMRKIGNQISNKHSKKDGK